MRTKLCAPTARAMEVDAGRRAAVMQLRACANNPQRAWRMPWPWGASGVADAFEGKAPDALDACLRAEAGSGSGYCSGLDRKMSARQAQDVVELLQGP